MSTPFSKNVFIVLLICAAAILVTHLALNYVSIVMYNHENGFLFELSNRFDVNDENSVPQWFSQMLFFSIAVSAALAAYLQRAVGIKRFWGTVAMVGLVLSIDDTATLHEFVLQSLHNALHGTATATFLNSTWWVVLPFILTIGFALIWWAWRILPRRTILLITVGAAVYVLGKFAADSAANDITDLFMQEGVMQGVEKFFQYTGASIILYSILSYIEANHSSRISKAINALRH